MLTVETRPDVILKDLEILDRLKWLSIKDYTHTQKKLTKRDGVCVCVCVFCIFQFDLNYRWFFFHED